MFRRLRNRMKRKKPTDPSDIRTDDEVDNDIGDGGEQDVNDSQEEGQGQEEEEEEEGKEEEEEGDGEESVYSYVYEEEEEDDHSSGFLADDDVAAVSQEGDDLTKTRTAGGTNNAASASAASKTSDQSDGIRSNHENVRKSKWKEPSREAVSMSLRAEREKSGGKKRLARDLYNIMMNDTEEAGFAVEQKEDCFNEWTVRLFQFDEDSDLHKDLLVLGLDHIELNMTFPQEYPYEPPFVHVVRPRLKRGTGFVIDGALCMELLTKEGWNPINDIESVIVSIRSILVEGKGRLEAAAKMPKSKYQTALAAAQMKTEGGKKNGYGHANDDKDVSVTGSDGDTVSSKKSAKNENQIGSYSKAQAKSTHERLSDYHEKKGWISKFKLKS